MKDAEMVISAQKQPAPATFPTRWPDLSAVDLTPSIATLHLFSQVVGKVRLMLTPWENHGWHVPLYPSARGLTTGLVLSANPGFALEFDLHAGVLRLATVQGLQDEAKLVASSVAEFHATVMEMLRRHGIDVRIDPMPAEIDGAIPFDRDHRGCALDLDVVRLYWTALLEVKRVFQMFRTRFTGKCSPIHLFWGAFDLAVTRFSGRSAPIHPGGVPHLSDTVTREAYCREVSSAGFWPNLGSPAGPSFYSYAYPTPVAFAEEPVQPREARFDVALGEFMLPYSAVASSPDPQAALLDFLQSTYEAAANCAHWDREFLERSPGEVGRPSPDHR